MDPESGFRLFYDLKIIYSIQKNSCLFHISFTYGGHPSTEMKNLEKTSTKLEKS